MLEFIIKLRSQLPDFFIGPVLKKETVFWSTIMFPLDMFKGSYIRSYHYSMPVHYNYTNLCRSLINSSRLLTQESHDVNHHHIIKTSHEVNHHHVNHYHVMMISHQSSCRWRGNYHQHSNLKLSVRGIDSLLTLQRMASGYEFGWQIGYS